MSHAFAKILLLQAESMLSEYNEDAAFGKTGGPLCPGFLFCFFSSFFFPTDRRLLCDSWVGWGVG